MDHQTTELQKLINLTKAMQKDGMSEACAELIKNLEEEFTNYKSIDQQMVALLKETFDETSLHKKSAYETVAKSLEEGSLIIYFRSAQLFKVYKREDVEKLLGAELRTVYRNLALAYEIIPNEAKQKIVILGDISLIEKMDTIRTYITTFMQEKNIVLDSNDIICYVNKEADMIEIIINNYCVQNSTERDKFVCELLQYIRSKEKDTKLTRKLGLLPEPSVFSNTNMVSVPTSGRRTVGGKFIEYVSTMICNTKDCHQLEWTGGGTLVQIGSVNITNNNNTQVVNTIGDGNQVNVNTKKDPQKGFIDHIKKNKPDWYVPNQWVVKSRIQKEYEALYGEVSSKKFHNMFYKKIFGENGRPGSGSDRSTMVQLFNFDKIKD